MLEIVFSDVMTALSPSNHEYRKGSFDIECVPLPWNVFSYCRMCSLTVECVLLLEIVFSYLFTTECVLLLWNAFSYQLAL